MQIEVADGISQHFLIPDEEELSVEEGENHEESDANGIDYNGAQTETEEEIHSDTDYEDGAGSTHGRHSSKRPLKGRGNVKSKRQKLGGHSKSRTFEQLPSNSNGRPTRHRNSSTVGLYKEESDIDDYFSDSSDGLPKSSRLKSRRRR